MARGGFPGMGGMNMNNLVKQAQKMQKQMAAMQEELNEKTLEMTSGGGAVKVVISGKKEIKELKIEPAVGDTLGAVAKNGTDIRLKLNSGFEFVKSDLKLSTNKDTPVPDVAWDDDEVTFEKIGDRITGAEWFKIAGLKVEATSAKAGAVATLKVYADGNDTVSVEVAKVVDSAVVMSVDKDADVPVIYSGVNVKNVGITSSSDHEALEVTVKETFPGACEKRWYHKQQRPRSSGSNCKRNIPRRL